MLKPVYKTLLSEQTLRYCLNVLDAKGNEALSKYLPDGVSLRECLDKRSLHGPFSCKDFSKYFDIAIFERFKNIDAKEAAVLVFSEHVMKKGNDFLDMYLSFLSRQHIDLIKDKICVAPFAQAANGGVLFNENCETGVDGLYVAGELAGGLHGADRLGGLACGGCFVFGKRAADSVALRNIRRRDKQFPSDNFAKKDYLNSLDSGTDNKLSSKEVLAEIARVLTNHANVVRTEKDLITGLSIVEGLNEGYNPVSQSNSHNAVKAKNSIKMAMILLTSMIERKESRGAHFRRDYPNTDNSQFDRRISISCKGNKTLTEYL
jgi:succinate dehydrogenase/fumarate reductase flavoprotein subunit